MKFISKIVFFIFLLFTYSTLLADEYYDAGLTAFENGDYRLAYQNWIKSSDNTNAYAQYSIGYLYENGLHLDQNFSKALVWYLKAAANGNVDAQYAAGKMYLEGVGVQIDHEIAITFLESAARSGNIFSILKLGDIHFFNELSISNQVDAEKWYQLASDLGSAHGAAMLGLLWRENKQFKKTPKQIISQLELAVSLGSVDAEIYLGLLYKEGDLVAKDLNKSQSYFESVLNADPDLYTSMSLAEVLFEKGGYTAVINLMQNLITDLDMTSEDTLLLASAYNLLGRTHLMQSRVDLAEENFLSALKIFESLPDNSQQMAMVLNNLGLASLNLGKFYEADNYFEESLLVSADNGVVYNNLGISLYEQGRYELAENYFNKSLILLTNEFGERHMELSPVLNSLGILYFELGRHREAEESYQEALDIIGGQLGKEHQYYATTFGNLVNVWSGLDQFEKALNGFKALSIFYENALGVDQQEYAVVLNNLANLKARMGDYESGIKDAEKAVEISKNNLGEFHPDLINLYTGLSKLHFHSGNAIDALANSKLASNLVNLHTLTVSQNESEKFIDYERIQNAVYFNVALMTKFKSDENLDEILMDLQLFKSVFGESTLTEMGIRLGSGNKELQTKIRFLQDEQRSYQSLFDEYTEYLAMLEDDDFKSTVLQFKANLSSKLNNIIELQKQINTTFPRYAELLNPQPLTLSETQDFLGIDEGLFTFVSDDETEATYAFMVTKNDARAYQIDLSEAQIAEFVRTLRAGIDLSNSVGIGDLPNFDMNLSYHLYSSLFGPAEDMLYGVKHLLLVPTGPLESLPLNLLVTKKPEIDPAASVFDNYQAAAWLPKNYSLTRLPSVSSLRALRVFAAAGEAKEPFIGFGDPILKGDVGDLHGLELASVYRGTTADIDQVRNLPELPDTADELKRIAQYLRAPDDKIYLRERATETVLKNTDLTNSRVVAFATHGLVGGEISGLAEPALVLSPPDEATEEDDGLLKASEVAQLKMNADIIMLSACNTASGDELGAEGLSGLARAFIYAGARSLLVSHWSVESTSAAELTTGMFDAMSADKSIGRSEALQMSMVDLMTGKDRSYYSHPAFWAPFSLVGDGATLK